MRLRLQTTVWLPVYLYTATAWAIYRSIHKHTQGYRVTAEALRLFGDIRLYTATNDRVATRLPAATAWAIQEYTNIHRAMITAEALRLFGDMRLRLQTTVWLHVYLRLRLGLYTGVHKHTQGYRITAEALRLFGDIRLYGYKRPCGYTSTCGYTAWAIQEYTNIHRARITAEALRFFGDTYGYGLGYTGVYKHNRKHIYIYIYIYIYIQPHKSTSKHI